MPPSPRIGSTSTATTFLSFSAMVRIAPTSLYGARTKPPRSGSKPACTLRFPVAVSVAIVRPWKLSSTTTTAGAATPLEWP